MKNLFVGPPFKHCTSCGSKDAFGVFLSVDESDYRRRCTSCGYEARFDLPPIEKALIYIDQFAISSMAAAVERGENDRWTELWGRLDRLVHQQLIACPASLFHYEESVVWKFYEATRSFYERLSGGIAFHDYEMIRRHQLHEHALLWANERGNESPGLQLDDVIIGDRTAWQPRLMIGARLGTSVEEIDELRRLRDEVAVGLVDVFKRWQSEKPTYEAVFQEEARAYGWSIIAVFSKQLEAMIDAGQGHLPPITFPATAPTAGLVVITVRDALLEAGMDRGEVAAQAYEYLLSESLRYVPFNEISSSLYASIARKAAAGQRKPPTRGLTNDIRMVSSLLPYCDAMFLDNECAAYLHEAPASELSTRYDTKIYSLSRLTEFIAFLDEYESRASSEQLQAVAEFYGDPG